MCPKITAAFIAAWFGWMMGVSVATQQYCHLQCRNKSSCSRLQIDAASLGKLVQSGAMVEFCEDCPSSFAGVACDVHVDEACVDGIEAGQACDMCAKASERSAFAGYMCKDTATEYCRPFDPSSQVLTYCTNGGKCVNNELISSSFSTGLTKARTSHDGCRCPPEFEGPHCEHLKSLSGSSHVADKALFIVAIIFLVSIVTILLAKERCSRQRLRRTAALNN